MGTPCVTSKAWLGPPPPPPSSPPPPPPPPPHVLGEQQPLRGLSLSLVSLAGSGNYSRCSCAVTVAPAVFPLAAIVRERSPVPVRSNIHHYTTVQYSTVLYCTLAVLSP